MSSRVIGNEPGDDLFVVSRQLLGGKTFSRDKLTSKADVHSAIVHGVPYASLFCLVDEARGLPEADVVKVLGISSRTLRRQSALPQKKMPPDVASKAWVLAETLARGAEVFGGREEAERWLSRPAMGLDGQRPIDLLQTLQGAEIVSDFLTRLEHGVYT